LSPKSQVCVTDIFSDTLKQLKSLLRAETASLFLLDRERKELVLNSVLNQQKAKFEGTRQRIGEGVAGSVAHEGKAILVTDIKTDPRFVRNEDLRQYHTDSFVCVPLLTKYGILGIISFSDKASGEPFSKQDFELICLVANLAAHLAEVRMAQAQLEEENSSLKQEKINGMQERVFLEKFASMGKLAGGIVHEINNPLDAVLRYTNLLLEKDLDRALAREYLSEIKTGLTRMTKITRSLLDFAQQLNDNHYQETVCVHDLIEEALAMFRHNLYQGKIHVDRRYTQFLPKVLNRGLGRIFSNIIKNAFDAMAEGGTLTIATLERNGELVISFQDTGCGIPADVKEKIFTPFFTTKPIGQGIGLGLPICFEVVQRYGGRIELDSQIGRGTDVRVHLPFSKLVADKPY
jgi:signal transduction histidine kinase